MARWDEQPSLRSRPERTQFGHDRAAFEPPHHEQVDYYEYAPGLKRKLIIFIEDIPEPWLVMMVQG
jgi:hypothetical protein